MKTQESSSLELITLPSSRPSGTGDSAARAPFGVTSAVDQESMHETLEYLIAAGPVVATLPPRAQMWSPEKRLAGATLASALVEIRDHHSTRSHRNRVVENLRWVSCEDTTWPFSFIRLCQLFDLDPSWVRAAVARWMSPVPPAGRPQPAGQGAYHQTGRACTEHRRRRAARARRGLHAALA